MANYCSWMITAEPFQVKNPEGFLRDLEGIQVSEAEDDYSGLHYKRRNDGKFWLGGCNADLVVHPGVEMTEVDVAEIVKGHIQEDQTAVFKVVGQEKLRAVSGAVIVVTWCGVESRTLEEMAFKLRDEMSPLKQAVKKPHPLLLRKRNKRVIVWLR